jgi:hypothetical protein
LGPVNWIAVALAAAAALAMFVLWNGRLFRPTANGLGAPMQRPRRYGIAAGAFAFAAVMMGHNFARIGAETLSAKPWLYFMQTGGVAVFFVIPAVWLTQSRAAVEPMRRVIDAGLWLVAYLAMGLVFWALG